MNSAHYTGKSNKLEDLAFTVNKEAAKEICRQLRLRDIGGIIVVDFIDMKDPEHKEKVLQALERATAKDPVQTTVVDMTALGLVEVTRKKVRKSFYEQLKKGQD